MSDSTIKTPFSDAVGPGSVPKRGSGPGRYDKEPNVALPQRQGGVLPELYRDDKFGTGGPSSSGPIKGSPFKDAAK